MKNLFKFLLLGAFTLSLGVGFVGCKNYDDDIKEICERLDNLEAIVDEFNGARYVTNVTESDDDITFTFNEGNPVVVAKSVGDTGTPATGDEHPVKISGSLTEGYTLSVWDGAKYVNVAVPTAANAYSEIQILGWVSAGATSSEVTANVPNWTAWTGDETKALEGGMIDAEDTFNVNYAYIDGFKNNDVDYTATPTTQGGGANTADATWTPGKVTVVKGGVLNTLGANDKGFIVQAFPSTANLTNVKFKLVSNDGIELPIGFGTPERVTGRLTTRAAGDNGLWFVPGANTTETFVAGTGANAPAVDYIKRFPTDAVYTLFADGVSVSPFTPFTATSTPLTSTEAAVVSVQETADGSTAIGATNLVNPATVNIGGAVNLSVAYVVQVNKTYKVNFTTPVVETVGANPDNATTGAAATAGTSNAVIDYTLKTYGTIDKTLFDVQFNATNTEFTVKALTDELTLAPFVLEVTKLGVNGAIYKERVVILPERVIPTTVIPLGNYDIVDGTPSIATDVLGKDVVVPLDRMFNDLKGYNFSSDVTMDQIWTDNVRGAKSYRFVSVVIKGAGAAGADVIIDWTTTPTVGTYMTALGTAGGTIDGNTAADGSATGDGILDLAVAANETHLAKSLVMATPYALPIAQDGDFEGVITGYPANTNTDGDVAFIIGKEIQTTIEFVDGTGTDANILNRITWTMTPTLPALAALYTPTPGKWPNDVLNAWYPDSPTTTWAKTPAAGTGVADTEYSVLSTVPENGFQAYTAGVTWEIVDPVALFLATNTTAVGTLDRDEFVTYTQDDATGAETQMDFTLMDQYITGTMDETADNIDYNGDGDMLDATLADVPADLVRLLNPTSAELTANMKAFNAYGKVMTVAPSADYLYLGVYTLSAAERLAMGYKISIKSGMAEGAIRVNPALTDGIVLTPADSQTPVKIDNTMIQGLKYNENVTYDVFPRELTTSGSGATLDVATWDYAYGLISNVVFIRPANMAGVYSIVGADPSETDQVTDPEAFFFPVAGDTSHKAGAVGYINILPTQTDTEVPATITVRVTDRYGKIKQQDINFKIAAANE